MNIDLKDFRRALGKFATGVTVVTTLDNDRKPVGVTASSFNTVSMSPPLVLWSIDKSAYSAELFAQSSNFMVNVLGSHQVDISNRFASRGEDKFAGVAWSMGSDQNAPRLEDVAASFYCKTWNVYDGGDHHILVGEVLQYDYQVSARSLVFNNGHYAVSDIHPAIKAPSIKIGNDGAIDNHLLYLLRQAFTAYSNDFYPKVTSFGITVEEWRVLTVLADKGPINLEMLGGLVSQPVRELSDTISWLEEKQQLQQSEGKVSLTASGEELAHRLLILSLEYEQDLAASLDCDVDGFKAALKMLTGTLSK